MKSVLHRSKSMATWLLVIPTILWCYLGLFLTMTLWYPAGLSIADWQAHIFHFSVIYFLWFLVFFAYRLFDWDTFRATQAYLGRLFIVLGLCLVIAVVYFYFQPALLITPRRFLIVHLAISGMGILFWYFVMRKAANRGPKRSVFVHDNLESSIEVETLIKQHEFLGLQYVGSINSNEINSFSSSSIVIVPSRAELSELELRELFGLRNLGVSFVGYHDLYEALTRTIHLSVLTDMWFIRSIDYGIHRSFDFIKRIIDVFCGLLAAAVFLISLPAIGALIKLTSRGPIFFTQARVGQNGKIFRLYKYRTMTTDSSSDTWAHSGQKVTWLGKFLRSTRLDELPQSLNIIRGDMSIVGPRPEQVHIVEQLRSQIPYYDERHIVKPGLTGWAQLHVYASSVEETKRKLQYDLYYIKHRSLLFDAEIIVKTVYSIFSLSGK